MREDAAARKGWVARSRLCDADRAAAQRLVEADQIRRFGKFQVDFGLLRRIQLALRVEHREVVGYSPVVPRLRKLQACAAGIDQRPLRGDLVDQGSARRQGVGDLAEGGLDGLFIGGDGDVALRLGRVQVGLVLPGGEDRHRQVGGEGPGARSRFEQAAEGRARNPQAAGQGDRREEGGARRADVGVGRAQLVFRLANVGTAQQHR